MLGVLLCRLYLLVGEALGVEAGLSSSGSDSVTVGTPCKPTLRMFSRSDTLTRGAAWCRWVSAACGWDSVKVIFTGLAVCGVLARLRYER